MITINRGVTFQIWCLLKTLATRRASSFSIPASGSRFRLAWYTCQVAKPSRNLFNPFPTRSTWSFRLGFLQMILFLLGGVFVAKGGIFEHCQYQFNLPNSNITSNSVFWSDTCYILFRFSNVVKFKTSFKKWLKEKDKNIPGLTLLKNSNHCIAGDLCSETETYHR